MAAQFSQTIIAMSGDRSTGTGFVWALAAALLLAWTGWFCLGSVTVYEVSNHARLQVRAAPHEVDAPVAGRIVSTDLEIGRDVEAGAVLMVIDASADQLRLREEQTHLASIEAQIASLRREIAARSLSRDEDRQAAAAAVTAARHRGDEAQAAADFARGNEDRISRLVAGGNGARVDALKAQAETLKLTAAQNAWSSEVARLDMDARSRDHQHEADIEALRHAKATLEGEFATAEATIARLNRDIDQHSIRAPVRGRLGEVVPLRAGGYVAAGQRLATVVPYGDMIVVADFTPSLTLGRVHPGQVAHLRLDSFPWAQYGTVAARVTHVASEVRDNLVRVEFAISEVPDTGIVLQHGLPGSIDVTVEASTPARLALRSAGILLDIPDHADTALAELHP